MSQYIHDAWGTQGGFLGGDIYAISQSSDGYLWIGTARGLVRFDGSSFSLMQRPVPDAPAIGPVRGLESDADGNLWVLLEGPHMLRYRAGKFEDVFAHYDLQGLSLTAMSLDSDGNLLVAELGDRVLRYRNGGFETVVPADNVPGTVIAIAETRDHSIWMAIQDDALYRMSEGPNSDVSRVLAGASVTSLLPATNGGLWIGTDHGIRFWGESGIGGALLPSSITQGRVMAMAKDREFNLWVGTDHGLVRIDRAGVASSDDLHRSSASELTAIYTDRDGDVWIGGRQGIQRLRDGTFKMYTTAQALPSDSNGPLYVDAEGRTWFAPLSGGLYWLKGGHVGHITAAGLGSDVVYSISGGGNEIWLGRQRGGLTRVTWTGQAFTTQTYTQADGLAQNSVYAVHRSRDGTVWAGTVSGGVSRWKNGTFTSYSAANGLASNAVTSIVEGQDGRMWFATPAGLSSVANGNSMARVVESGLPSQNVTTLFEDRMGVLWIATANGLAFLSSGQLAIPRNLPEALREQILGMAEDKRGSLWMATSDHVIQVNRKRLLSGSLTDADVQSYGTNDGLLSLQGVRRERSVIADLLGRIWFSLNRGIAVTDPKLTAANIAPVMVRIDSMSAGGQPVDPLNPPKIAAGNRAITFNYAATSLSPPDRVRFRYRLEGSGEGWSDAVPSRQVVYTNLGPGSYRFLVIASNSEGLWNGPETVVPFVIKPAFWQTWWFRILWVAVGILVVFAIYRLRMYELTKRLNARFQERLAERTRIAQELHDTLLQGVLSASMQLDVAEDQLPDDSPAKPLLKRVLALMGQVTVEGRNALQGLRTADGSGRSLEVAFSRIRQEFDVEEKIGYRVISPSVVRPLHPLIRDEVYRIGREALVNAFLHARANSVEVEVEYASRHLRVLVRDDGRGIDPQVLTSGRAGHWGLAGMRERSESIGASLRLRSRIGAGTEVELTVPSEIAFKGQSQRPVSYWLPWVNRETFETASRSKAKGKHK
jgi:ligand-binding sensor domain-containing protein/signal transduction histidine kinase